MDSSGSYRKKVQFAHQGFSLAAFWALQSAVQVGASWGAKRLLPHQLTRTYAAGAKAEEQYLSSPLPLVLMVALRLRLRLIVAPLPWYFSAFVASWA
jgi:hypothetical protein